MTLLQGSKMTGELHSRNSILSILYLHFFHIEHIKWPNGTPGIISGCGSQLFRSNFVFYPLPKHDYVITEAATYKKGVFRTFTKFTGKHLCQSLFFQFLIKLQASNTFLTEHLWTTASAIGFFSKMHL